MSTEVRHYKVRELPQKTFPNVVYYLLDTNSIPGQFKVKAYITDINGNPIPLLDLSGNINSVTGTGVTGSSSNPIIDIATFLSSQINNKLYLSVDDGKLFVKPIISPDSSIDIGENSTEIQIQVSQSIQDNILDILNDIVNINQDIQNLENNKFDNPTGDNTEYLDGAGVPTPFPNIPTGDYNDLDNLPDLTLKEDKSNKGIANGYGSLDINGKQPLSEINDALIGNVHWKGIYNGTIITSSPDPLLIGIALPSSSSSNTGWYFIAQGSFTHTGINYETGDWIISDGSTWNKVDNTDVVSSVNGKVGNVILNTDDIQEAGVPTNKWWSNLRTITSTLTGYVSGAGVISAGDTVLSAIQKLNGLLSLKQDKGNYRKLVAVDAGDTTHTGTLTETIVSSILIPANSLDALCDLFFSYDYGKNASYAAVINVYLNTSNTLTGATLFANYNSGSNRNGTFFRKMILRGTSLDTQANNDSLLSNWLRDMLFTTTNVIVLNPAVNNYILVTITLINTSVVFTTKRTTLEKLNLTL